jgi:hypothetical protein
VNIVDLQRSLVSGASWDRRVVVPSDLPCREDVRDSIGVVTKAISDGSGAI